MVLHRREVTGRPTVCPAKSWRPVASTACTFPPQAAILVRKSVSKNTSITLLNTLRRALTCAILHKTSRVCLNRFAYAARSLSTSQRAHITARTAARHLHGVALFDPVGAVGGVADVNLRHDADFRGVAAGQRLNEILRFTLFHQVDGASAEAAAGEPRAYQAR